MKKLSSNPVFIQLVKFVFVGCLNVAIYYGLFVLMLQIGVHYIPATSIGMIIAIINSYFWNKFFTFKSSSRAFGEKIKFLIVHGVQYLCNILIIHLCVTLLNIMPELAGLFAVIIGMFVSFFGHKFWSFKVRNN